MPNIKVLDGNKAILKLLKIIFSTMGCLDIVDCKLPKLNFESLVKTHKNWENIKNIQFGNPHGMFYNLNGPLPKHYTLIYFCEFTNHSTGDANCKETLQVKSKLWPIPARKDYICEKKITGCICTQRRSGVCGVF